MTRAKRPTRPREPEPAAGVVGRYRQVGHNFLILLEELVMAIEWAEGPLDAAVDQSGDQVTKLSWARVKDKIKKVKEAP